MKPPDSNSSATFLTSFFANFSELIFGAIRKVAWVGMSSSRCLCRRCVASKAQTGGRAERI